MTTSQNNVWPSNRNHTQLMQKVTFRTDTELQTLWFLAYSTYVKK